MGRGPSDPWTELCPKTLPEPTGPSVSFCSFVSILRGTTTITRWDSETSCIGQGTGAEIELRKYFTRLSVDLTLSSASVRFSIRVSKGVCLWVSARTGRPGVSML